MASEHAHKIDGAVRKLRAVMEAFDMKGTNRATMLNAINTINALNTRPAPAATDTGLETRAWLHPAAGWAHASEGEIIPHCLKGHSPIPLVARSQAEELLAAERVKNETQAETIDKLHDIITKLEADNAAQAARIKGLEADRENGGRVKGVNTQYANALAYLEMTEDDDPEEFAKRLWDEREALEAKLAAARKALTEIYGNGDATGCNPQIKVDIARAALEVKP